LPGVNIIELQFFIYGEFSFGKDLDLHENLCPLHSRDNIEMYIVGA